MSTFLLALWIALIGADRIDLAGGRGPFILTPFIALTPVVVVAELLRRHLQGRPIVVTSRAVAYAAVTAALACVVLLSVFGAGDIPVAAPRASLLVADIAGTFLVALLAADRPDLVRILARGAIACLVLFAIFDIAEALAWFGWTSETLRLGPVLIELGSIGSLGAIPRLAGPVIDANRGGFVLLFYGVVIAAGEPRIWLRRVALTLVVVFLILTFSRSSTLGGVAVLVVSVLTRRRSVSPAPLIGAAVVMVGLAAFLLIRPGVLDELGTMLASPLGQHLSAGEGSARGHIELIQRGLSEATASVPRAAIGLGYGNSYLALQDIFPGNRYGNFHSLYVTMFAEAGVFALILALVLMATPVVAGGPLRGLVAGAMLFNMFYQTTTEPVFWFVLALAWMTIPVGSRVRAAAVTSPSGPETRHRPLPHR